MARVASYQVLRDTTMSANMTGETVFGTFAVGFTYTFFVPPGLITDRNRARPVLECQAQNANRNDTELTFHVGDASVITVRLDNRETREIREVFDWRTVSANPLVAGESLTVRAMYNPNMNRTARLSDLMIWYQIDTDAA